MIDYYQYKFENYVNILNVQGIQWEKYVIFFIALNYFKRNWGYKFDRVEKI
jgi:hypothetical protein